MTVPCPGTQGASMTSQGQGEAQTVVFCAWERTAPRSQLHSAVHNRSLSLAAISQRQTHIAMHDGGSVLHVSVPPMAEQTA